MNEYDEHDEHDGYEGTVPEEVVPHEQEDVQDGDADKKPLWVIVAVSVAVVVVLIGLYVFSGRDTQLTVMLHYDTGLPAADRTVVFNEVIGDEPEPLIGTAVTDASGVASIEVQDGTVRIGLQPRPGDQDREILFWRPVFVDGDTTVTLQTLDPRYCPVPHPNADNPCP